jgi:hypothetical protein
LTRDGSEWRFVLTDRNRPPASQPGSRIHLNEKLEELGTRKAGKRNAGRLVPGEQRPTSNKKQPTPALPNITFPVAALLRIAGGRGFHPRCGVFAIASLEKKKARFYWWFPTKPGFKLVGERGFEPTRAVFSS